MTTVVKWLLPILVLLPLTALAEAPDHGPRRKEPYPFQYNQSCGFGQVMALQLGDVGDGKQFKAEGVTALTGTNFLFRFGEQVRVSTGTTGPVLLCEHMTTNSTISLGHNNNCGEGCGVTTDGTYSRSGVLPCHVVGDVGVPGVEYFKTAPSDRWSWDGAASASDGTNYPTVRRGRCTTAADRAAVGGGCALDSECGTGGVCDLTQRPIGVYMSAVPLVGAVGSRTAVRVSICPQ